MRRTGRTDTSTYFPQDLANTVMSPGLAGLRDWYLVGLAVQDVYAKISISKWEGDIGPLNSKQLLGPALWHSEVSHCLQIPDVVSE